MTAGLDCSDKTQEDRVAEAEKHQAELLTRPRHERVAHIKPTAEGFIVAAEYQRDNGSLVSWLHNASMAEGVATAIYEMTEHHGYREHAVLRKATLLRVEAELALLTELRTLRNPPEPTEPD